MDMIQRMIFKPNKAESGPTWNATDQKRHLPLFKVKSGVKSGTANFDFNRLSIDNLSHSKGTLDDTLNSDLFY